MHGFESTAAPGDSAAGSNQTPQADEFDALGILSAYDAHEGFQEGMLCLHRVCAMKYLQVAGPSCGCSNAGTLSSLLPS